MKNFIYFGLGIAGAVALSALLASSSLLGNTTAQQPPSSVATERADEFLAKWEANEKIANEKASIHPEITKFTEGALAVNSEFYPGLTQEDGTDRMLMHIYKERNVVGDWQSEYTVTYSGHAEIVADFADNQITKVEVTQAPDEIFTIGFTDERRSWISQILEDSAVQKLTEGRDWYVRHIHMTGELGEECPFGDCRYVIIEHKDKNESLDITFNSATGTVVRAVPTANW